MLGGLLALIGAALFGLNNAATRRATLSGSVIQGMAITVPLGVPLFLIAALVFGGLEAVRHVGAFSWSAIAWLSMAGFLHFVFGRYCNYRAIAAIGTNLASPIQQWELLVSLVFALALLGEVLTPIKIIGIVLLVLGPWISTQVEARKSASGSASPGAGSGPQRAFEPRYAEGYTFAFLSIFGYGLSPICVRAGLENATIAQSMSGGLVSYIAAAVVMIAIILALGQVRHVMEVQQKAASWFAFAGFMVFLSQMFRYMALAIAPVSVVAPIMRIQVIFRIYFSWILTRDYEVFDRNVIIGTVVSVIGAILLTLQTEAVLALLPLPPAIEAVLRWHWP